MILYKQARYHLAELEFKKELALNPQDYSAHAMLAASLSQQQQYDKAKKEVQASIHLNPDYAFAHFVLSVILLQSGKQADADKAIKEALRLDPYEPMYYAHAADLCMNKQKWSDAVNYADQGLVCNPEHLGCINTRAQALVRLGRYTDAEQSLDYALSVAPEDSMTHSNKGWTLIHRGRIHEAIDHFQEALRLNPQSDWAYQGVVEALKARNPIYHFLLMGTLSISEMGQQARSALYWICVFVWPLRMMLIVVVLAIFVTRTVFTFLLRLDPLGRRVLTDDAKRSNNFAIACLAILLAAFINTITTTNLLPETHSDAYKASSLLRKHHPEQAIELWRNTLTRAEAIGKTDAGESERALQEIDSLIEDKPEVPADLKAQVKLALGKAALQKEHPNPQEAESKFRAAVDLSSRLPDRRLHALALIYTGASLKQQNSTQEALSAYRLGIQEYELNHYNTTDELYRSAVQEYSQLLEQTGQGAEAARLKIKAPHPEESSIAGSPKPGK